MFSDAVMIRYMGLLIPSWLKQETTGGKPIKSLISQPRWTNQTKGRLGQKFQFHCISLYITFKGHDLKTRHHKAWKGWKFGALIRALSSLFAQPCRYNQLTVVASAQRSSGAPSFLSPIPLAIPTLPPPPHLHFLPPFQKVRSSGAAVSDRVGHCGWVNTGFLPATSKVLHTVTPPPVLS